MPQQRGTPIRQWIAKAPHPAKLIAFDDDGKETPVVVRKGKWADAEEAVLDAAKIHALDPQGIVLRVYRRPDVSDGAERENELGAAKDLLAQLPKMFVGIADAIGSAADKACQRQSDAFGKSFEALTAVVKAQSDAFTASMQQNRELQSEMTGLAKQLREEMLDAAEGEAQALVDAANGSGGAMAELKQMASELAPVIIGGMLKGEEKAS